MIWPTSSRSWARLPGGGREAWRTWRRRSNWGSSVQDGFESWIRGVSVIRWRKRGTRGRRAETCSSSSSNEGGAPSRISVPPTCTWIGPRSASSEDMSEAESRSMTRAYPPVTAVRAARPDCMAARLGSAIGLLAMAIGLAACGGAAADPTQRSTPDETSTRTTTEGKPVRAPTGVRIKAQGSNYGKILVTGAGRTLYLFDKEKQPKSECYGACARAWPPVLTKGRPVAGPGARQDLLGTTSRNGKTQVTYAGHPLYLYAPESPGEILCQDVFEYGGLWLIVRPSGRPVR